MDEINFMLCRVKLKSCHYEGYCWFDNGSGNFKKNSHLETLSLYLLPYTIKMDHSCKMKGLF